MYEPHSDVFIYVEGKLRIVTISKKIETLIGELNLHVL